MTEAAKRGELPPMKHYHCEKCGFWHLARKHKATDQIDLLPEEEVSWTTGGG